jgi:hypothetical protein
MPDYSLVYARTEENSDLLIKPPARPPTAASCATVLDAIGSEPIVTK